MTAVLQGLSAPSTSGAVLRLPVRLSRRGVLLMAPAMAAYAAVEVVSYRSAYPDQASREQLVRLADSTAVRALQGAPHAVDTVGGFVVWDAGWFVSLLLGTWALLLTTRLLRGEEDAGRGDVVLARPLTAVRLLRVQLGVVAVAVLVLAGAFAATLAALGAGLRGSLLTGAGLAGAALVTAATAALAAQLLDLRRRAVAVAAGLLGLSFGVRVLAGADPGRERLLWLTPAGWLDLLEPYSAARWPVLLLPYGLAGLLAALAVRERARRDTGGARWVRSDRRPPREALLGSPLALGWRLGLGVLLSWLAGTFLYGLLIGALVRSVVELVEDDPSYRRTMEDLGIDLSSPTEGFLAAMAASFALVAVLQVCFRLGSVRAEEDSGRLENLLVRPVGRRRWVLGAALLALLAASCLLLVAVAGVLLGGAVSGADLDAGQVAGAFLATLPVVALFGGLSLLALGAAPRLTVVLPVTVGVLAYLLTALGPVLDVPDRVVDLSPFSWLPLPPAEPWSPASAVVLSLVALAATLAGAGLFARRDLTGA